jgi:hypothetical protein
MVVPDVYIDILVSYRQGYNQLILIYAGDDKEITRK